MIWQVVLNTCIHKQETNFLILLFLSFDLPFLQILVLKVKEETSQFRELKVTYLGSHLSLLLADGQTVSAVLL